MNQQDIINEYAKCYSDKSRVYMIENFFNTFDGTQKKTVKFKLFPRQIDLLKTIGSHDNVITTKPRQAGISTTVSAKIACELALASKDSPETVLIVANRLDLSTLDLKKIKEFLLQVPRWFWGENFYGNEENDSRSIFTKDNNKNLELHNGCKVHAVSSGPNAARGVSSVSWLIFDEAAFIEKGREVYSQAVATTATGGHIIMISTPNGQDELYYDVYKKAIEKENNFKLVELKWYQDPRYNKNLKWEKLDEESGEVDIIVMEAIKKDGSIEYKPEYWEKLLRKGYKPTSDWYAEMCNALNNDRQKIAQELDVSFLGSAGTVVDSKITEFHKLNNVREPIFEDDFYEGAWVFKEPIEGHRYIMPCLPENEKVLTDKGLKNIQDVNIYDDMLFDESGELTKIKNRQITHNVEEYVYELKLSNVARKTTFTRNHPILVSQDTKLKRIRGKNRYWDFDFNFIDAENLQVGDWVKYPNIYTKQLKDEEILSKWKKYEGLSRSDFNIENPLLEDDFWWYAGIWLAEGWVHNDSKYSYGVQTAHNINEVKYKNKIDDISEKIFNRKNTNTDSEKTNSNKCRINSKQLYHFFNDTFGRYAKNKKLPEWVKFLPVNLKTQLIKGYFNGDGCLIDVTKNNKKNAKITFVSISLDLLEGVQDILFSLGIISTLQKLRDGKKGVVICNKKCNTKTTYELNLGNYDSIKLLDLFKEKHEYVNLNKRHISNTFLSDDNKFIFHKIKGINKKYYSGDVFNFETESHTFLCKNLTTHNCDVSTGSGEDSSVIHVLDIDAIHEETGMPCIEQVFEYRGKVQGDILGDIGNKYGIMYGDALAIIDCVGSSGDACLLKMQSLNYKNIYSDDPNLKNMTNENAKYIDQTDEKKITGFRAGYLRMQMLSNLEYMLRNNNIIPRSKRFTGELDTWIWKNGRPDHQGGSHDDTITSMAMGLFVYKFSLQKLEGVKQKNVSILKGMVAAQLAIRGNNNNDENYERIKKIPLPFYSGNSLSSREVKGSYNKTSNDINKKLNIYLNSEINKYLKL